MYPCCAIPANRNLVWSEEVDGVTRYLELCCVCSRKHPGMIVPPIKFGVQGAPTGEAGVFRNLWRKLFGKK